MTDDNHRIGLDLKPILCEGVTAYDASLVNAFEEGMRHEDQPGRDKSFARSPGCGQGKGQLGAQCIMGADEGDRAAGLDEGLSYRQGIISAGVIEDDGVTTERSGALDLAGPGTEEDGRGAAVLFFGI